MDEYIDLANAIVEQAVKDYRKAKRTISTKTEYRELAKYEKWAGKHIAEMLEREADNGIIPESRVERFESRRGLWGGVASDDSQRGGAVHTKPKAASAANDAGGRRVYEKAAV